MIKKFSNIKTLSRIREQITRCREDLRSVLSNDYTIYYIDECMFTTKTYLQTDWAPVRMNVPIKSSEFNI